jgi:hypothetical protein
VRRGTWRRARSSARVIADTGTTTSDDLHICREP